MPNYFRATHIITEASQDDLLQIVLAMDNTFGPMGSGGYEVRRKGIIKCNGSNVVVIYFTECDCAPAKTFVAFVGDKIIYARNIAKEIMGTLKANKVSFRVQPDLEVPEQVRNFIERESKKD